MSSKNHPYHPWATSLRLVGAVLLALAAVAVQSAPVSEDRAEFVASNWMRLVTGLEYAVAEQVERPVTLDGQQVFALQPAYYIYNMAPSGWVIVSGDDVAHPVIGYSTAGAVSGDDVPPALSEWLQGAEEAIRDAAAEATQAVANVDADSVETGWAIADAWQQVETPDSRLANDSGQITVTAVAPLLTTTWSQGMYYNAACPVDAAGPDGHALVGCGATAMGQVMRYHGHPARGAGAHSYVHPKYGTISADFESTTYEWGAMPSAGTLSTYNTAVGVLLHHAGVALDMNYGPDASGCNPDRLGPALRNHFRYAAGDLAHRSSHETSEWLGQIRADLDAYRPVVYFGYGGSGGHGFVCDGYTAADYFHFNWGWNGAYDGYFYLNALTPGGTDFSEGQAAVFGIRPGGGVGPAGPALISPRGTIVDSSPPFRWNAVSGANRYRVYIETGDRVGVVNAWYTADSAGCADGTGECLVVPGLLLNGAYRWAVQSGAGAQEGAWSQPLSFTVASVKPAAPTLVAPKGVVGVGSPEFLWNRVEGAVWYLVFVQHSSGRTVAASWYSAEQAGCGEPGTVCTTVLPEGLVNGHYTWWVAGFNGAGLGPWSAGSNFEVRVRIPGAAELLSPEGVIGDAWPTYRWTPVDNAPWYYLLVQRATGQTVIGGWSSATDLGCDGGSASACSATPSTNLAVGDYTWRVLAWNSGGVGPWSTAKRFRVEGSPPGKATIVSPEGAIATSIPTYQWNAVASARWYYLLVLDAAGAAKVANWFDATDAGCPGGTGQCSVTPNAQLGKGPYVWYVGTLNGFGFGGWSSPLQFRVMVGSGDMHWGVYNTLCCNDGRRLTFSGWIDGAQRSSSTTGCSSQPTWEGWQRGMPGTKRFDFALAGCITGSSWWAPLELEADYYHLFAAELRDGRIAIVLYRYAATGDGDADASTEVGLLSVGMNSGQVIGSCGSLR